MKEIIREMKLDILEGKYKCTNAYQIPDNPSDWNPCPICGLRPLIWEFDNGRATACGCGKDEYDHFSVHAESIMSVVKRCDGSCFEYESTQLNYNWNYWACTEYNKYSHEMLKKQGKW